MQGLRQTLQPGGLLVFGLDALHVVNGALQLIRDKALISEELLLKTLYAID